MKRFIGMLIGGIIGVGIASLIRGEIQWGLLIGLLIGIIISEWKTKDSVDKGEVKTDERVDNNMRKFMISTFGLSNFLLLIYLVICDLVLDQQTIEIRYLIYYVLATFFVCLFIGPVIVKRK
ncbi:hypothetical protein WMZ97_21935 [Lentibacillus sp. N15]|uniref:hypothetical protein n=1 Tax=Lentibacillus songyuanensis TaxID=3136161 RepID=UPI0031BA703D